eukprot:comp15281_c0_seq1/m.23044 comp15281_c0_seq1/g.23044  ORF comp15281_c0_seq1/g.23044 comp15281_c0_seq1/m.23044 type:complete len:260 (+) comp15281_c0_seq1:64-843(+)
MGEINRLRNQYRAYLAEFMGTFLLVFLGCGAAAVDARTHQISHLGVGLCFGLVIMVAISAFGHVSGAHLNPVVSITLAVSRFFPWHHVPGYLLAQLSGSTVAAGFLYALFDNDGYVGATLPSPGTSVGMNFGIELIATTILLVVVLCVAVDERAQAGSAAIAIGGTVALLATVFGPIQGASMNPARSFGPAIVSGQWDQHWVYWIAPISGGFVGLALWFFIKDNTSKPDIDERGNKQLPMQHPPTRETIVSEDALLIQG